MDDFWPRFFRDLLFSKPPGRLWTGMARSQSEFGRHGVLDVDRLVGNFEGVVFGGGGERLCVYRALQSYENRFLGQVF